MRNKPCTFYVVRHGETEWNQKGLVQGHTDIPLTASGEQQAQERAHFLKDVSFEYVISSDLQRAKKTASILVQERALSINITPALREQYWGSWEGYSFDKLREMFGSSFNDYSGSNAHRVPGVETHQEIVVRVGPFLKEIAHTNHGKNILVVTHGGVLKSLIFHLGVEFLHGRSFNNLGFIKLESDGEQLSFVEAHGLYEH
jgi:broad specificity phosphatase PhoE